MSIKSFLTGGAFLAAGVFAIAAARAEGEFSDYLWLQTSDTGSSDTQSSFYRANWGPDCVSVTNGNQALDYYVPAGMTMYAPYYSYPSFKGKTLAVAGNLRLQNQGYTACTITNLHMESGSELYIVQNSEFKGRVTFHSTNTEATVKLCAWAGRIFSAKVAADTGATVRLKYDADQRTESSFANNVWAFASSWADFKGKAILSSGGIYNMNLNVNGGAAAREAPGYFEVESNAVWYSSNMDDCDCTSKGFTFKSGSMLRYHFIPASQSKQYTGHYVRYVVTDSFSATGDFKIDFGGNAFAFNHANIENPHPVKLIHANAGATVSTDTSKFSITNVNVTGQCGPIPKVTQLEWVSNADGSKDLCPAYEPFVYMFGDCGSSGYAKPAFENDSFWSTGKVPTSDFEGYVLVVSNKTFECSAWKTHNYPGMRLVKPTGGIYAQCNNLILDELHIFHGVNITAYYTGTPTITANCIKVWPYDLNAKSTAAGIGGDGRMVIFNAPLAGDGNLSVKTPQAPATPTQINLGLYLKQNNSEYHGQIVVGEPNGNFTPAYDPATGMDVTALLKLAKDSDLGGVITNSAVAWKGITLKYYATLTVDDSMSLTNAQRGIYIDGAGRIAVPAGKMLALAQPITLGGTLLKTGTGLLKYTGTLKFSDAGALPTEVSPDPTNAIFVTEGALAVGTRKALKGAKVNFGANAALAVDLDETDSEVRNYGADFSDSDTTLSGDSNTIVASLVTTNSLPDTAVSQAICTLSAAQAATLTVSAPAKLNRREVTVTTRANADDSITYIANVAARQGLFIFFK